jgi:hypothetical protein
MSQKPISPLRRRDGIQITLAVANQVCPFGKVLTQ